MSLGQINSNNEEQARQRKLQKKGQAKDQSADEAEELMARPPQSMRDIYKISNRNRKKNKQKKKVSKGEGEGGSVENVG